MTDDDLKVTVFLRPATYKLLMAASEAHGISLLAEIGRRLDQSVGLADKGEEA